MAVLKKLPIIYLVQDNEWDISASADEIRAGDATQYAKGFKGLETRTIDGTDFLTINPRGYVPILVLDDGQQLSEGPAIVQYIADRAPAAQLAPAAGSFERTRLQEWLGFINSELHQNFGLLFNPALHASTRDTVVRKLRARLDWVSEQIQGKRFALGEQFSVADGYLFAVLGWTRFFGMNLADWPVLAEHSGRVASRPAVQAALRAEGLTA
jgi:glutathione S-transferase